MDQMLLCDCAVSVILPHWVQFIKIVAAILIFQYKKTGAQWSDWAQKRAHNHIIIRL